MFDSCSSLDNSGGEGSTTLGSVKCESMPDNCEMGQMGQMSEVTLKGSQVAAKRSQLKNAMVVGADSAKSLLRSVTNPNLDRQSWSRARLMAIHVFENRMFDIVMGVIILFNVFLLVIEADAGSTCTDDFSLCTPAWVNVMNYVLLGIYTVELVGRLYVWRLTFLSHRWNIIDLCIVVVAFIEVIISNSAEVPGMQLVRIFRLGRLARIVRVLKVFPMLYGMVRGFTDTMTTILWGFVLILSLLLVWSLLSVELIHPRNKLLYAENGGDTTDWCFVAFSSVGSAIIYYFQTLVAGDSWGLCAIPLIEEYYETFWIFSLAFITVQLGFTNLVLAVIVDAAAKVRESDMQQKVKEKKNKEKEATERLLVLIKRMDLDGSGTISWEELKGGFDSDPDVQDLMAMLNIDEKDLRRMFDLMDSDHSGSLDYNEFLESLMKAEEQDERVSLMLLKLHMSEISWKLDHLGKTGPTSRGVTMDKLPTMQSHPRSLPLVAATAPRMAAQPVPRIPTGDSSPPAEEGEEQRGGWPDARRNPREVMAALEQELSLMSAHLGEQLERLAQETAEQVSTLAQQTRSLSAALASDGSNWNSMSVPARSQWSRVQEHPAPTSATGTNEAAWSFSEDFFSGSSPEKPRPAVPSLLLCPGSLPAGVPGQGQEKARARQGPPQWGLPSVRAGAA